MKALKIKELYDLYTKIYENRNIEKFLLFIKERNATDILPYSFKINTPDDKNKIYLKTVLKDYFNIDI